MAGPQPENWLTLVEAAGQLHVHPTTLRKWANAGDIPVMLTPGGHRRFSEADVTRFAQARRSVYKPGRLEQVWAQQALQQTREAMRRSGSTEQSWLAKYDDDARQRSRVLGHSLMELVLRYVLEGGQERALIKEAEDIGREYAHNAREIDLPLADALRASMFFRDTLIAATHQMPDDVRILPEAKVQLLQRINTLLNTVQLAVAEVYDAG